MNEELKQLLAAAERAVATWPKDYCTHIKKELFDAICAANKEANKGQP